MDKLYHVQCLKHYIDDNNYSETRKDESFLVHATYPIEAIEKVIVACEERIDDYPIFRETTLRSNSNKWDEYWEYTAAEVDLSMDIVYLD